MEWLRRKRYRIPASYALAVWLYTIIFAFISGVFPKTAVDWLKFVLSPFLLTIQLPFLYMRKSGWLFSIVVGVFWVGIYYLLKALVPPAKPSQETRQQDQSAD